MSHIKIETLEKGRFLFHKGDEGNCAYLIIYGSITFFDIVDNTDKTRTKFSKKEDELFQYKKLESDNGIKGEMIKITE